jgi:hypothetical protein
LLLQALSLTFMVGRGFGDSGRFVGDSKVSFGRELASSKLPIPEVIVHVLIRQTSG